MASRDGTKKTSSQKEAELNSKIDAIDKVQAIIEFELDGTIITANRNFLDAMGYELEEIQGKHHRIFVDEKTKISQAYRDFWHKLNRGEYDTGEYKRLAKGDREIWIQASYNPIFDEKGKAYSGSRYLKIPL